MQFGLRKRVRPVFAFIDQDAKQFQKPAILLGHLIFWFFHEGRGRVEQAMVFRLRSNDDGQGHIEKLSILTFIA